MKKLIFIMIILIISIGCDKVEVNPEYCVMQCTKNIESLMDNSSSGFKDGMNYCRSLKKYRCINAYPFGRNPYRVK